MATGRFPILAALLLAGWLPTLAGCKSAGPITSRRNTMGMLKSSVSQLEASNQDLKRQVATLRSESSRFETELAQERQANGELTARLDDAKQVIRRHGGDVTALNTAPARASTTTTGDSDEIPAPARPSPARRSSRTPRKPPAAALPTPGPAASATITPGRGSSSFDVDPGPQTNRDDPDDGRWLPIARSGRGRGGAIVIR